jgi:hypothetical protein
MSKDDIRTVADVRREIWTQGLRGLGYGSFTGFLLHTAAGMGNRRQWWKVKLNLNRNTAMLSVLLGGALGSFINASTAGKNEVHKMHPVFQVGAKSAPPLYGEEDTSISSGIGSSYQQSLQRAKEREADLNVLERRRSNREVDPLEDERVGRERNRLYRRATNARTMEAGHGGLSDAHGGHWAKKVDDKKDGSGSQGN